MDAEGGICHRLRRATPQEAGYDAILDNIVSVVSDLESAAGEKCLIGIGTPGALGTTGMLKNSNTLALNGRPVKGDLESRLGRTLRMENDANCFALSEATDGAAAGKKVVFGVIMGTGVGGGIVVNGETLSGLHHIGGEWGHNPLEPDGPGCYCGRRGCVETLISGPGFARDYANNGGHTGVAPAAIIERAKSGEPAAVAAEERFLKRFGRALAVVINILDPDVVVLGGGLSNIGLLYTVGPKHVVMNTFNDNLLTQILPNHHGDSSGVRGAAQLWPAGTEGA